MISKVEEMSARVSTLSISRITVGDIPRSAVQDMVASLFSGGDANDLEALEHTVCSKQMETLFTSGRLSLRLSMTVFWST